MKDRRVAVLGAGPAGLAAAMQLKRQGREPLLLEGSRPGGLLLNANLVENYPGFPGGISGQGLVQLFLRQARGLGVVITPARVNELNFSGDRFQIETDRGSFFAEFVVAATGTKPKPLTGVVVGDSARGDLYDHVVSLRDLRSKKVLIIGAGDAALDYALNLARFNQVVICNRGTRVKGLGLLWERVQAESKIEYRDRHQIREITRARGGRLHVQAEFQDEFISLEVDAVLAAVGRRPAAAYMSPGIRERLSGLREGGRLFLAGDIQNDLYRQTAIAVGDGVKAAMEIEKSAQEVEG